MIPNSVEVIRSRDLGRIESPLTRHQRVAFSLFLKNAYLQMLQVDDGKEIKYFKISTRQFREELGIKHRNIYSDTDDINTKKYSIETQLKQLMSKILSWSFKDDKKQIYKVKHSVMLSDFEIDSRSQTVTYSLGNFVQEKVLCYGNAYISSMNFISKFKSTYSVALYEQIEQRRDFHKWRVEVQELRKLIGIEEGDYLRMDNFKKRVIETGIKEISGKTNYFNLQYTTEKIGRNITHLKFTWGFDKPIKKVIHSNEKRIKNIKASELLIKGIKYNFKSFYKSEKYSEVAVLIENSENNKTYELKLANDIEESLEKLESYII